MIGLVVTPSEVSWVGRIAQNFRLLIGAFQLKDELAAKRVAIYPLEKVRQFQGFF